MKKALKLTVAASAVALSFALVGCKGNHGNAQSHKASTAKTTGTQLISKLTHGQMTVVSHFNAAMDLTGYIVKAPNGQQTIFYTDKKGQYLIAGNIINAEGKNLTQHYTNEYIIPMQAKAAYANLKGVRYITDGKNTAPHKMYMVWDPNCSICHIMYGAIKPMIKSGQLQVRFIPVAIRGATSTTKSAEVLNAKTDAAAMAFINKDEAAFQLNYKKQIEAGGLKGITKNASNAKAFAQVKTNTEFFMKSGFQGTPVVLYKDTKGEMQMLPGFMGKPAFEKTLKTMGNKF